MFRELVGILKAYYMSYSLDSSKGRDIVDYIGEFYWGYLGGKLGV